MSNVVPLKVTTLLDLDPQNVLSSAASETFDSVIVIGMTADGEEYLAMSSGDGGQALWQIERAKLRILRTAD